jgi:hypothetical protein
MTNCGYPGWVNWIAWAAVSSMIWGPMLVVLLVPWYEHTQAERRARLIDASKTDDLPA